MTADPALALLASAPPGDGARALLLGCSASPDLMRQYASRYAEAHAHEDMHAAALRISAVGGLRPVPGDLPCCLARPPGPPEDFLPESRFPEGHFDRIVYRLGRGTAQVNAALLESFRMLRPGGTLLAAAANQEGAKSFARRAESLFGNGSVIALKHSCRLLRYEKRSDLPAGDPEDPEYYRSRIHRIAFPGGEAEYRTKPGVFAYRETDAGTALLGRRLPDCAGLRVLDLCCGSGALALAAYARGAAEVDALDASAVAVSCATRNLSAADKGGRILWADLDGAAGGGYDLVVANPPFHVGGRTDYSLPARVADAIASALRPGGEAWVVANQFLDYAGAARGRFARAAIAEREPGFILHHMAMAG